MNIIVGLGNPGKKYQLTRHNVGFVVVDKIVKSLKCKVTCPHCYAKRCRRESYSLKFKINKKFKAETLKLDAKRYLLDADLLLVKPQTFMNNSGDAVKKIITYNKNNPHYSLLITHYLYVIHDDLDIKLGEYKISFGKGPKLHKGIKSIEDHLGTKDFWRVRIGIATEEFSRFKLRGLKGEDYVLQNFSFSEQKILNQVIIKVVKNLSHVLQSPPPANSLTALDS